MQMTSQPAWITPGILPLDDSSLREKIYQTLGHKYAYSPTAPNLSLNSVDYSALSAPCSSCHSYCTVGSGGPLSVVNQLKTLSSLKSKAIQDPPALNDLDCDTVLREIYKITGNTYAYSPTRHNICLNWVSDLDQWGPLISVDSKDIEDLATEKNLAQAISITPETATALASVTCAMGLASCVPYDHFLVSANEWQDMKNHWKPIFTFYSNMREMNEVEQGSTLILTHAVNLTSIHLCVVLPDCILSVLLTRLHGSFRATGKLHFGAGGQKLASNIIAWIHQLRDSTFASSTMAHNNSIPWMNYNSQHAQNYILSGNKGTRSSVGQLAFSDRVDSSSILILTRPVQLAISQLTLALQVCNLSGSLTKRHGNSVPVGQLLKAKALSQIMSTMTSLRDIRVIPNFRTRKSLQLASDTTSIHVPAQLSDEHRGNKNTALSLVGKSLLPHNYCSSKKEDPTNHHNGEVIISDVAKDTRSKETKRLAALPLDENVLLHNNEYGLLSNYAGELHPSNKNKKKVPTGCFKWLWRSKKTALPVDTNDLPQNVSSNEHDFASVYACVLLPSAKKKEEPTGCFSWLWRSKKITVNSVVK